MLYLEKLVQTCKKIKKIFCANLSYPEKNMAATAVSVAKNQVIWKRKCNL